MYSPDNRQVLSVSLDGIRVCDAESGDELFCFSVCQKEFWRRATAQYSPTEQQITDLVALSEEVYLIDAKTGQEQHDFGGPPASVWVKSEPVRTVVSSHDGTRIATGSKLGLMLWNAASGECLKQIATDPCLR